LSALAFHPPVNADRCELLLPVNADRCELLLPVNADRCELLQYLIINIVKYFIMKV